MEGEGCGDGRGIDWERGEYEWGEFLMGEGVLLASIMERGEEEEEEEEAIAPEEGW